MLWKRCLQHLENELPQAEFNMWIRPLQCEIDDTTVRILAPNRYIRDRVEQDYLQQLKDALSAFDKDRSEPLSVVVSVGDRDAAARDGGTVTVNPVATPNPDDPAKHPTIRALDETLMAEHRFNADYSFDNHVEGKSNQLARAAAIQVGENPGAAYNPLFIYGGVGLGKTHLMQAAGNLIRNANGEARVAYAHSERFVNHMVRALQENAINDFKRFYRSLDALLIDDIQFFAGKTQSQEEFFHTFNTLLEGQRQVVITSDRFPKQMVGVEERLRSRFESGLTVHIEPPELETRVAILHRKAHSMQVALPEDVAFFVAEHIRSNVRELEGAMHRLLASGRFTGRPLDMELATEALKDVLPHHERHITVEKIQKTVADYYHIRVSDLLSKRRNRQISRPRQMSMALCKDLTELSLPMIGDSYGGRDHTTVLHACRQITKLRAEDEKIRQDYDNLSRQLTA